ncbi:endonuclease domain-containing protein [Microbacterium sp. 22242]|uniref:endonuclease domain-containing protein n=1 Tax=Microbacterium sp. 22242 TaxID=3453896 RepID=UPI003F83DD3A
MMNDQRFKTFELRAQGYTTRSIAQAARDGRLIRLRQGQYTTTGCSETAVHAGRLGGRADCVTALTLAGVFVRDRHPLHVQMTPHSARQAQPSPRITRHWRTCSAPWNDLTVPLVEALAQSLCCQQPRDAVASLDSALHQGLIDLHGLDEVFELAPRRKRVLRRLVDGRAESGPETLVRLAARALGFEVVPQVQFDFGRVDLVLDGWLVVECDSRAHHEDWAQRVRDYERDRRLAALGFCVLRLVAEDIMYDRAGVVAALRGMRGFRPARRRIVPNSVDRGISAVSGSARSRID